MREIDVVILRGAGRFFSAGRDLKDSKSWYGSEQTLDQQREMSSLGLRMARAWEDLPQITIAAIDGYAVGGGVALAAALDWRVLSEDAFLWLPEIALGIPLTWGTLPRLVNLVGVARAKRLTILCERFSARDALEMGLVDYVSKSGESLKLANKVAQQVLALPQTSVRMSKESIQAYAGLGAHAATHMAHDQVQLAAGSAEAKAAREAFALRKKKGASAARSRRAK